MDFLEKLLARPPGPGLPHGPSLTEMLGSPHGVLILMAAMLLVLARTSRQDEDASREQWLVWAFAAILGRETLILTARILHVLSGPPAAHPPGPGHILAAWSEHVVSVVLVAAFLRYLTARQQPARTYLLVGAALLSALSVGVLILGPPPAADVARQLGRPPLGPAAVSAAGLASMIAALALTYRSVNPSGWLVMFCGLGAFIVRDLVELAAAFLPRGPGAPAEYPIAGAATVAGFMLFGYLFVRERSAAAHTDFESLEGLVMERTSELESALERLSHANELLVEQSSVDSLTGLYNRRSFDEKLLEEWARAHRSGAPLGVALVDIDRFKAVNDRFGHPAGDECLMRVAAALQAAGRRPGDVTARYGGDEFAVLLPGAEQSQVVRLLDGVRREIAGLRGSSSTPDLVFTVSVGTASARAEEVGSVEELIRRADDELYRAKQGGRNRVGAVRIEA